MWALVWWILGTHMSQLPSVAIYQSQDNCLREKIFIEEHVKILKIDGVHNEIACVEATKMDSVISFYGSPFSNQLNK